MIVTEDSKLRNRVLEYEKRLQVGYVHRRLFLEGVNPFYVAGKECVLNEKQSDILPDIELLDQGNLLILGNAGSGKSFIMYQTFVHGAHKYLRGESSERPILLDCHKPLGSQSSIKEIVEADYGGFVEGVQHTLLVDGVDEGRGKGFVRDLGVFFDKHKDSISEVILTCRRTYWRNDWFSLFGFPEEENGNVFNADYLEYEVYKQLIPDDNLRKDFFHLAQERGIDELLDHPFEGFFLARRFVKGKELPDSRFKCFDLQINECLKGTELNKREPSLPTDLMRNWASRLAATTVLSGENSWNIQQALDYLNPDGSIDPDKIADFLDRPLFYCTNHRYTFSHQLYSEFLVAKALKDQPIRKQRMFLTSDALGIPRIIPELRGVAIFLSSFSSSFADWLGGKDTLVAYMGEPTYLSPERKEQFLGECLDFFISKRRAPWHDIPPHGGYLNSYLRNYKPRDVASFVSPYLSSDNEFSRCWGVFCVEAWGGEPSLNSTLIELSLRDSEPLALRTRAVKAIELTEDEEALRHLYPLIDCDQDQLRGKALQIYMELEKPTPSEFIPMLMVTKHQTDLPGPFELVAEKYGRSLDEKDLPDAFQIILDNFDKLFTVRVYLLKGLFDRANQLDFDDVPIELILATWTKDWMSISKKDIVEYLKPRIELKQKVWQHLMNRDPKKFRQSESHISQQLSLIAGEEFLDWIPDQDFPYTDPRYWFVAKVLSSIYNNSDTSQETKEQMQKRFPDHFPKQPQPTPKREPDKPSIGEITDRIKEALKEKDRYSALAALEALKEYHSPDFPKSQEIEDTHRIINELPVVVKLQVFEVFRKFVEEVKYVSQKSGGRGYSMTYTVWSIPFWILCAEGVKIPIPKIKEFLLCYGFKDNLDEYHKKLLDELWDLSEDSWRETVVDMIDSDIGREREVLEYLKEKGSPIYIKQCGERLRECSSSSYFPLGDCLEYWKFFKDAIPRDEYREVLWVCYNRLKELTKGKNEFDRKDNDPYPYLSQFSPLSMLLTEDDDRAWKELEGRIQSEDVPIGDIRSAIPGLDFEAPNNPERIPVLVDWYALCRRKERDTLDSMSRPLRYDAIVKVGGLPAIQRLRELQNQEVYTDARWDSYFILELEDGILSRAKPQYSADEVITMLSENKYIVKSEVGLWEVICEALDELQRSYQQGGYSTNPYWEGYAPKLELGCHEILWPLLKEKLDRLGVSQVEERLIRPNILDFQIEKPIEGNQENLKVCIELKIARKGYGETRLLEPIEHQLWEKYMRPEQCQHGFYIVLWFKTEDYPYPKAFETPGDLLVALRAKCHELGNRVRNQIEPYVIDMTQGR
jgi:hypothetical protein